MSGTAARIDAFGITAPDYADVLAELTGRYRAIYGQDAYLEPDSQDGALLAIFALALHDANSLAVAAYQAFSPASAQGEGLSRVVKINGIGRASSSYSTADVLIAGQVGTVLSDAVAMDQAGGRWTVYGEVAIGPSGTVTAQATAQSPGAVTAAAGAINQIGSPVRGWQSVTNPAAARPGQPVEGDAALRLRQQASTALPSRSILDGITGAVLALPGVSRVAAYENDTASVDARGIPDHTISLVVDGGDPQAVADTIGAKKGPGAGTYGTTQVTVVDAYSIPRPIAFFRPSVVPIAVSVALAPLPGYTAPLGTAVQAAVAAFINALPISAPVRLSRLYVPIDGVSAFFNVTALAAARRGEQPAAADVVLAFNEAASCDPADVAVTLGG